MTKIIKISLSDEEYDRVDSLVCQGFGRSKSDFARSAVVFQLERYAFILGDENGGIS